MFGNFFAKQLFPNGTLSRECDSDIVADREEFVLCWKRFWPSAFHAGVDLLYHLLLQNGTLHQL